MMTQTPVNPDDRLRLDGDQAKQKISEDAFGLSSMVEAIANALTSRLTENGYVVGIDGKWGSGKSTLVNFITENIQNTSSNHHIIKFEPWLIGERDSLLSHFFGLLAAKIDELDDGTLAAHSFNHSRRKRDKKLSDKIRLYGQYTGLAAIPMAGVATLASGSFWITAFAISLNVLSKLSQLWKSRTPIFEKLKEEINADLKTLAKLRPGLRFCVVIDDLDRLEPTEAIEILRLVKKVGDFPYLTYLLCFDHEILVEQVKQDLGIGDGKNFLEKIFQNIVPLPPQEPFALRRFLRRILQETFPGEMNRVTPSEPELEYRYALLFDRWVGHLIQTPRDVIRLRDAAVLMWPAISKRADFYDFVWLQLIKLKAPNFYIWIQNYLTNVGGYRDGGRPGDGERHEAAMALQKILEDMKFSEEPYRYGLGRFLPGVKIISGEIGKQEVYKIDRDELAMFEKKKRLGSPSHWRLYFAFDKPSYAIDDSEIVNFREVAGNDPKKAAELLVRLSEKPHDFTGHFVDVLLDRLADTQLSSKEVTGMGIAFGEVIDDIAAKVDRNTFGTRREIWRKATNLLANETSQNLVHLVETGKSLNWLAHLVRLYVSPNSSKSRDIMIKDEDRERVIHTITTRFQQLGAEAIFQKPEPLDILYCWKLFGDKNTLREFIEGAITSDSIFLDTLNAMRSWVESSDRGIYFPLRKSIIGEFMNADKAKARLDRLASEGDNDSPLRRRARELVTYLEEFDDPQIDVQQIPQ